METNFWILCFERRRYFISYLKDNVFTQWCIQLFIPLHFLDMCLYFYRFFFFPICPRCPPVCHFISHKAYNRRFDIFVSSDVLKSTEKCIKCTWYLYYVWQQHWWMANWWYCHVRIVSRWIIRIESLWFTCKISLYMYIWCQLKRMKGLSNW